MDPEKVRQAFEKLAEEESFVIGKYLIGKLGSGYAHPSATEALRWFAAGVAFAQSAAPTNPQDFRCGRCGELLSFGPCDETTIHVFPCETCGESAAPQAERPAATPRSAKDYAIEHGGYLADAAEAFLEQTNIWNEKSVKEPVERGFYMACLSTTPPIVMESEYRNGKFHRMGGDFGELSNVTHWRELPAPPKFGCDEGDTDVLNDHWRALESAIGEFRKRVKRAECEREAQPLPAVSQPEARREMIVSTIFEEMLERDWSLSDIAIRMGGTTEREIQIDQLALHMYLVVANENVRLGAESARKLSKAFDMSEDFFINLESGSQPAQAGDSLEQKEIK